LIKRIFLIGVSLIFALGHAHAQVDPATAKWDGLLKSHVVTLRKGQATQVNYAAFAGQRAVLKDYLDFTGAVTRASFDAWPKADQLAFLINVYNARTVELILTAYPKLASIKDLGSVFQSPWKKKGAPLLGEPRSLDDIEHGLIRGSGRYNDPRIHFAVNCASIGCPALKAEAFVGKQLEAQLEEAAAAFLSDRTRNRLEQNTLKVSSIFKWYREDFEKGWRNARSLEQFLALYATPLGLDADATARLRAGTIKLEFLDYDWRLNGL
jgi:Protein of unknown function, DUF547